VTKWSLVEALTIWKKNKTETRVKTENRLGSMAGPVIQVTGTHHAEGLVNPKVHGLRIRKYQFENRSWELPLPTFFKTRFLLHKLLLKLEKVTKNFQIFGFFFKSLIFECNHSKTVWDVFHDLKNVKIAEKSMKIGQLLPILANFISESTCSGPLGYLKSVTVF
jgi:hypothetical protein